MKQGKGGFPVRVIYKFIILMEWMFTPLSKSYSVELEILMNKHLKIKN